MVGYVFVRHQTQQSLPNKDKDSTIFVANATLFSLKPRWNTRCRKKDGCRKRAMALDCTIVRVFQHCSAPWDKIIVPEMKIRCVTLTVLWRQQEQLFAEGTCVALIMRLKQQQKSQPHRGRAFGRMSLCTTSSQFWLPGTLSPIEAHS